VGGDLGVTGSAVLSWLNIIPKPKKLLGNTIVLGYRKFYQLVNFKLHYRVAKFFLKDVNILLGSVRVLEKYKLKIQVLNVNEIKVL